MKVQRYPQGQSNIGLLKEQKSNIMTPEFAAGAEAAKYNALADVADDATEKLVMFQKERMQEQRKLDKLTSTTDTATLGSNLDVLRTKAESERWTQEEWTEASNAEIDAYLEKSKVNISEGNRDFYAKAYEANAIRYRGVSAAAGEKLNLDRTKESWLAAYDRLGAAGDYKGQMMLLEEAGDSDGVKLFAPDVLAKLEREVQGEVESDALIEGYKTAVQENRVDEYMNALSKTKMSDETETAFHEKRKQYDVLTKEVRLEQDKKRAADIAGFTQGITAGTTDKEIYDAANRLDITQYGTINSWFSAREQAQKADKVIFGDFVDPHDMGDRKALNNYVTGETVEDRIESAQQIAIVKGVVPEYLDGYYNSAAYGTPADLMVAGDNWIELQEQTPGVPNGVNEPAAKRLNLYRTFKVGFGGEKAAQMVTSHFDGMNNERREANRKAYNQAGFGNQEDLTVRDYVIKRTKDKLAEMADIQMAHAEWGTDEVPRFPAEMMKFIESAGENLYSEMENEEAVVDTMIQGLINSGWKVTGINDGVATGDLDMGVQWMKSPPPRPEMARAELADDFKDQKFLVNKVWTTVDPERVEFWRKVDNPETGMANWILRVDGALIFNGDMQKQTFEYTVPQEDTNADERTRQLLKRLEEEQAERDDARTTPKLGTLNTLPTGAF